MGWKLIGISAKEALDYDQFDVDEKIIIGDNFGDESEEFISMLDFFLRVGDGKQSLKETQMAKEKGIPVYEYDI